MTSTVIKNGTYTLTLANLSSSGTVTNEFQNVSVTVNGYTLTFTANGVNYTYTYNYSWGSSGLNELILGDTDGGYYIVTTSPSNIGTYSYHYNSTATKNNWTVSVDGTTYTMSQDSTMSATGSFNPCFLAGTLIKTRTGLRAVEDLKAGDEVCIRLDNGTEGFRDIIWTGKNQIHAFPRPFDDMAGYPVRILKNAIADGVPFKDMLVTAEHCLFFDGKFIPVRMLVNGISIFYDYDIPSYEYYHIETEDHSVITADGVLTESYLNTGNRHAFEEDNQVITLAGSAKNWAENAAAPLVVERAVVEPIFQYLADRARQMNVSHTSPRAELVADADLHLVTNAGQTIYPTRQENQQVVFDLPAGVKTVRLVSRSSRPYDTIGPFVDDRRLLGVLVGEITAITSSGLHKIETHLKDAILSGWHGLEDPAIRWTNGNAFLPLDNSTGEAVKNLEIQIIGGGPYLATSAPDALKSA